VEGIGKDRVTHRGERGWGSWGWWHCKEGGGRRAKSTSGFVLMQATHNGLRDGHMGWVGGRNGGRQGVTD